MGKTTKDDGDKEMRKHLKNLNKIIGDDSDVLGKDVLELSRSAGSKRVLLVVPTKLLNDFQVFVYNFRISSYFRYCSVIFPGFSPPT